MNQYVIEFRESGNVGKEIMVMVKMAQYKYDVRELRTYMCVFVGCYIEKGLSTKEAWLALKSSIDPRIWEDMKKVLGEYYVPNAEYKKGSIDLSTEVDLSIMKKIKEPPYI